MVRAEAPGLRRPEVAVQAVAAGPHRPVAGPDIQGQPRKLPVGADSPVAVDEVQGVPGVRQDAAQLAADQGVPCLGLETTCFRNSNTRQSAPHQVVVQSRRIESGNSGK